LALTTRARLDTPACKEAAKSGVDQGRSACCTPSFSAVCHIGATLAPLLHAHCKIADGDRQLRSMRRLCPALTCLPATGLALQQNDAKGGP
jgi:hypothetical protein